MTGSGHVQTAPGKPRAWAFATALMFCLAGLAPAGVQAVPMTQPPAFRDEVSYLTFTIDHHYSALRMTELAAGTANVGSSSNYAGSPNVFPSTPAKATDPVALNVAVMANMGQRQEIIEAQGFLQSYYGISYTPSSEPYLAPAVAFVDQAVAGDPFNIAFLEAFSGHHATLIPSSQECTAAAAHADVQAYCAGIVASQTRQIGEMRNELATAYGITSVSYETVPLPAGIPASPVPEPASAAMVVAGLLGLGVAVRWARASSGGVQRSALSVH
jgi:uncharacterized protein (DUF305 family)